MKTQLYILTFAILALTSCDITRLQPCCRLAPGYGGFDRYKTLTLSQKTFKEVVVFRTEKYLIVLDKQKAVKKLSGHIHQDSLPTNELAYRNDTLDLNNFKVDHWRISKFITTEIDKSNVVIIDLATGQKLDTIKRRKFNLQTAPKMGRGGKEYIDPNKNYVIIRQDYWIS